MKHLKLQVRGIVQGVGFRPFIHRLADNNQLKGSVYNDGQGVIIEVEGKEENINNFLHGLHSPPDLSKIEEIQIKEMPLQAFRSFQIIDSHAGEHDTLISPDIAPCADCLRELNDPNDRRYHYPFINCTNCGPRYSIIQDVPYDRKYTTMSRFVMCDACQKEYQDIRDRRYHAQPDACARCGPKLLLYPDSAADPLSGAVQALKQGKIVAIKGIGGIHLACDAWNKQAIQRLRKRKMREQKPFAIMVQSIEEAKKFAVISREERDLLQGKERPIVLCRKKDPKQFLAISENQYIGLLLPYSPLHVLLMQQLPAVVLTSANRHDEPVYIDNQAALQDLCGIADVFLLHDRPIANRCDDSLLYAFRGKPYFVRRSRGYVPAPLTIQEECDGILALGAHQKGSFALGKHHYVFLSPYIGNLEHWKNMEHYQQALQTYEHLFAIHPEKVVCDLHPDYTSTQFANTLHLPILQVQHHHAHMAACMAEHQLSSNVFGIIFDGSGYGEDHTIWGAECLIGDLQSYQRVGSIHPILLPGGELAIHEIKRIAISLCVMSRHPFPSACVEQEIVSLCQHPSLCVAASSMGRLFDGVYALLTNTRWQSYDGQAPMLLESMADRKEEGEYSLSFYNASGVRYFDWRKMIGEILRDLQQGMDNARISARFMNTICHMAVAQCRALNPSRLPIVLSGGSFLNQWLLHKIVARLEKEQYRVYWHQQTACNDEGIAFGQLAIAAQRK